MTVVIVADRAFDATVDHVWFPSFTRFAPGALAALARLPHLRSASFADTDLDDAAGLDQLVHLPSLRVLLVDLRGEVTLEFLRALSARMPRCAVTIKGRGELRAGEWA
ncbi:MAG: hypothetical protein K8W52_40840 [Deltaproteobacteria bacterium]|nr:hypothetical protein [Deltaproteobacteria bacterium]